MSPDPQDWPANPFWDFSLRVYGAPGVATGLLYLQDARGLDVNLLLFCTWCGHSGPGRLAGPALDRACLAVGEWQQRLVQPLRALRREATQLPTVPRELATRMKQRLLDSELAAERVEQQLLAGQIVASRDRSRHGLEISAANLHDYLARAGVSDDGTVREALSPMLATAFPDEPAGRVAEVLTLR